MSVKYLEIIEALKDAIIVDETQLKNLKEKIEKIEEKIKEEY